MSGPRLSQAARPQCVQLGARPVCVVVVPPLVWRGLGIALRRVLPVLLATERGDVEIAPSAPHRLIATAVDEIGAKHAIAVADEGVGAVPVVHTEVGVEVVRQRVPRDKLPTHPRLQALYVRLLGPRDE